MSSLTNFNMEGRNNGASNSPRPNALANSPVSMRLSQPLRLPRVRQCCHTGTALQYPHAPTLPRGTIVFCR